MNEQQGKPLRGLLEIRYNFHTNALMALCFAAIAAIVGFFLVYGLIYGIRPDKTGQAFLMGCVFVVLLALAGYNGRMLFDNRAVVILTSEGFRDRRAGDVLIPWRLVTRVRRVVGPKSSGIVRFDLTEDPGSQMHYDLISSSGRLAAPLLFDGRQINIETASLDISQDDLIKAALEFAPHIEIGPLL